MAFFTDKILVVMKHCQSIFDYYLIHCLRNMALICFDLPKQFRGYVDLE